MKTIPTAEEFYSEFLGDKEGLTIGVNDAMIEFAKLHVQKIRILQQEKYTCGETGYLITEEWENILNNIK